MRISSPHGFDTLLWRFRDSWYFHRFSLFLFCAVSVFTLSLQLWNLNTPLLGSHTWRQADTLFTGYFFCTEDPNILNPRVAQREDTSGIAIGEFPLYSWVISIPCQISGYWSESTPKVITWLLFWLSSVFFSLSVARKWGRRESFLDLASLLLTTEITLTFLTRALPDVMGFFLISAAGWVWTSERAPRILSLRYFVGLALAITGFLVRPYLLMLAFFVLPFGVFRWGVLAVGLKLGFEWWFVDHVKSSALQYYLVQRKPFLEAWSEIPLSVGPLLSQVFKLHLNYILLPFFLFGFLRRFLTGGFWWFSVWLVVLTSGKHFDTHPYYMIGAAIFGITMAWACLPKSKFFRRLILIASCGIGIANSQHMFHGRSDDHWKKVQELAQAKTQPQDKIVVLTDMGNQIPTLLYFAKRTGWSWIDTPENRQKSCELNVPLRMVHQSQQKPQTVEVLDCPASP